MQRKRFPSVKKNTSAEVRGNVCLDRVDAVIDGMTTMRKRAHRRGCQQGLCSGADPSKIVAAARDTLGGKGKAGRILPLGMAALPNESLKFS